MKQIFFRLTKADETKREVSGVMVSETPDKMDEVFDYSSSKAHFQSWSDAIAKATDGKSLGNVREMHQSKAVGKLIGMDFDDDAKKIGITAKIVDDQAWAKVETGVLTGFSIGGSYTKKWADGDLTRYTAKPAEVSLVDNPCVPDAHFQLVRSNGSMELVKAVGGGTHQYWDCPIEGHKHAAKAEAVDCMKKYADGERVDTSDNTDPDEKEDAGAGETAVPDSDESLPDTEDGDEDETEGTAGKEAEKVAARTDTSPKEGEDKYGDVKFADAKNKKYPIDTAEHIRAAWNYINKPGNAGKYAPGDVKSIKAAIVAAWKKKIDPDGPPSASSKSIDDQFAELREMVGEVVAKLAAGDSPRGAKEAAVSEEKTEKKAEDNAAEPEKIEKIEKPAENDLAKAYSELKDRVDLNESNVTKAVEILGEVLKAMRALPAPAKGVARVVKSDDSGDRAGKDDSQAKKDATSLDLMKEVFSNAPMRRF